MQVFTPFIVKKNNLLVRIVALLMCVICTVMVLSQTVFARNTYVITDGSEVKIHSTYTTDPAQILNEAGVELSEDDIYTTQAGDGMEEITVRRGQIITVNNCGKETKVSSYGETVEELLTRLDIQVGYDCVLSADLEDMTYDGMDLFIRRVEESARYYYKDIAYETIYCYNATLPADYSEVVKAGVPGKLLCNAEATVVNGEEQTRALRSQVVVAEPESEIVVVGTGENLGGHSQTPAIGDGVLVTADGEILYYEKTILSEATAYTMTDEGCDEITATGTYARYGAIAVDPKVIPYFTKMFIVSNDGKYVYGYASAEDCGGAINGTRIDLYYDTTYECFQFGRRDCTIYILTD